MGRKKAKDQDLLKFEIKTRVNEKRYRSLTALQAKSNCSTMSELVRDILEKKPITVTTYEASFDHYMEQLIQVQKEINAIGVNINQITHFFNGVPEGERKSFYAFMVAKKYEAVGEKVEKLYRLVDEIREKWSSR